jgi:hypothetical protein
MWSVRALEVALWLDRSVSIKPWSYFCIRHLQPAGMDFRTWPRDYSISLPWRRSLLANFSATFSVSNTSQYDLSNRRRLPRKFVYQATQGHLRARSPFMDDLDCVRVYDRRTRFLGFRLARPSSLDCHSFCVGNLRLWRCSSQSTLSANSSLLQLLPSQLTVLISFRTSLLKQRHGWTFPELWQVSLSTTSNCNGLRKSDLKQVLEHRRQSALSHFFLSCLYKSGGGLPIAICLLICVGDGANVSRLSRSLRTIEGIADFVDSILCCLVLIPLLPNTLAARCFESVYCASWLP